MKAHSLIGSYDLDMFWLEHVNQTVIFNIYVSLMNSNMRISLQPFVDNIEI